MCTLDFSNYSWFCEQVRTFLWSFIGCPHVLQHGFARPSCRGGACSCMVIGAKENN